MTVEEFQVGQLYAVAEASKEETSGQTAIEILANEPYDDPMMGKGQYTHKVYHIAGRCPKIIQAIAPASALKVEERAWNAYPYCKTGERFSLTVESMHLDNDDGSTLNVLNADPKTLGKRKVQRINIYSPTDPVTKGRPDLDTSKFKSQKTGRGPLMEGWESTSRPLMCCYKLVTTKFKVFGLEGRAESMIDKIQHDIFVKFYKLVFCRMDEWYGLTMEDIRQKEEQTRHELDQYHVGQLFTLMETSRENTNGDSGVEIIANEPYDNEYGKGQYTHKIFYLGSKMPRIVAALLPSSAKMLIEKAWNAYPYCRTEYSNPFLGERFQIIVQSIHLPDSGTTENAHNLTPEQLALREIVHVDIAKDEVNEPMKPNTDPATFHSENQIQLLTKFHKEIFCAIDRWAHLDLNDIRRLEVEIKEELDKKIAAQEIGASLGANGTPVESVKSNPF